MRVPNWLRKYKISKYLYSYDAFIKLYQNYLALECFLITSKERCLIGDTKFAEGIFKILSKNCWNKFP